MARDRVFGQLDYRRVEVGTRAAAIGLILSVSALTGTAGTLALQLVLLTLLAIAGVLPVRSRWARRWRPVVEGLVASLVIAAAAQYESSLLPYLVAPALSAGLIGGWTLAVITSGAMIVGLLLPGAMGASSVTGSEFVVDAVQWSLLTLAVGLLAAWVRRIQTEVPADDETYLEASRLLIQLRDLSLELSGGLDAVSLASALLDELLDRFGITRGWVFGYRQGDVPVPLASAPGLEPELTTDLTAGSPWHRVMDERTAIGTKGPISTDPSMSGAIIPIRIRDSLVGLVAVERRGQGWTAAELSDLQLATDAQAVRFDAALLFDEVRTLATVEERQRLAREIHDGVAQEVASLGYLVDDLAARFPADARADLSRLREELTRVVGELRYSIFDLRREIGPGASLTSVLADHARHVGETASIAVHLELSESPARLRPAMESELLRIAQEAIANARKHSRAKNLWIVCIVDAPNVYLRVEDDGRGLLPPREDSFGLAIMQERSDRAGCTLTIGSRPGGGTRVEVRQERGHSAATLSSTAEGGWSS